MLSKEQAIKNKKRLLKLLKSTEREGIDSLIDYLTNSDFFETPASTKYHENYFGGLSEHSLNVYDNFIRLADAYEVDFPSDSIKIATLLHDVCKVDFYATEMKNGKWNDLGDWDDTCGWSQKEVYVVKDRLPLGHGEKSVMLVQRHIKLTDDEMLAINWHSGFIDPRVFNPSYKNSVNEVFEMSKLAFFLHEADMFSLYNFKKEEE